ncbi:Asp-tRNA(Asn)/Glu-tRNA(Gln) amidotransferase subunit GatC [Planctomycetales bacterium ZRK34]|nr:Asp-tRNA(Asn)/Glu-tRNA(Gln) amidotransferase subunit GatC [Planctomycetales bacterium ZRK34]
MSHQLTEAEVRHVAKLSRLKLTDEQVHNFTTQLGNVLEYIDKLSELDVENVEPMAHPTSMTNKLREDVVTEALPIDKVLHNAPASDPPYFKVPKVLGDGPSA